MKPGVKTDVVREDTPIMVYFVRHAQAAPAGSTDSPLGAGLTKLGEQQAHQVANRLARESFSHIYTSDLTRAYDTAMAILKYHADTPYTINADLREVSHFHFDQDRDVVIDTATRRNLQREMVLIRHFSEYLRRAHVPGEKVLVVSHGNMIRTILPVLGGRDPKRSVLIDVLNTAVTIADVWSSGEAVVRLANCVRHLLVKQIT
jgi:broad specificity phosphatase PhoE